MVRKGHMVEKVNGTTLHRTEGEGEMFEGIF